MLLAIDPGTKVTGYALFRPPKLEGQTLQLVLSVYGRVVVPNLPKEARWTSRADIITDGFIKMLELYTPQLMVAEFPQYMGGNKGVMAAKMGSTMKLSFLLGCLHRTWIGYGRMRWVYTKQPFMAPEYVYPNKWTGQLSKKNRIIRLNENYGLKLTEKEHDVADAIGIGIYYIQKDLGIEFLGADGATRNDFKLEKPEDKKDEDSSVGSGVLGA